MPTNQTARTRTARRRQEKESDSAVNDRIGKLLDTPLPESAKDTKTNDQAPKKNEKTQRTQETVDLDAPNMKTWNGVQIVNWLQSNKWCESHYSRASRIDFMERTLRTLNRLNSHPKVAYDLARQMHILKSRTTQRHRGREKKKHAKATQPPSAGVAKASEIEGAKNKAVAIAKMKVASQPQRPIPKLIPAPPKIAPPVTLVPNHKAEEAKTMVAQKTANWGTGASSSGQHYPREDPKQATKAKLQTRLPLPPPPMPRMAPPTPPKASEKSRPAPKPPPEAIAPKPIEKATPQSPLQAPEGWKTRRAAVEEFLRQEEEDSVSETESEYIRIVLRDGTILHMLPEQVINFAQRMIIHKEKIN
jgi:hypothetical protein